MAMRRDMFQEGMLGPDYVEWPSMLFYREAHAVYVDNETRAGVKPATLLPLVKMIAIWRQLCFVVQELLLRGRGTRVEGIGTFSLDVKKVPCFYPDPVFMRVYKISSPKRPIKGATLNHGVQYTSVTQSLRNYTCTRDDVEKVVEVMAEAARWAIDHGIKSYAIQLSNMGDFVFSPTSDGRRVIGFRYSKAFMESSHHAQHNKRPPVNLSNLMSSRDNKANNERRRDLVLGAAAELGGSISGGLAQRTAGKATGAKRFHDAVNLVVQASQSASILELRKRLFARHGLYAVRNTRQLLTLMDDNGDGQMNRREITLGFEGLGVSLEEPQLEALFVVLDLDGSGMLSTDELYQGLRGQMSAHRLRLINRLHDHLVKRFEHHNAQQRGGLGARVGGKASAGSSKASSANNTPATLQDDDGVATKFLLEEFSCDHFPDVKSNKRRAEDERTLFFSELDGYLVSPPNGFIGRAKMVDFYQDMNGAYENSDAGDDYFTFMVRSTWNFWDMKGFEPLMEDFTQLAHTGWGEAATLVKGNVGARNNNNNNSRGSSRGSRQLGREIDDEEAFMQQRPGSAASQQSERSDKDAALGGGGGFRTGKTGARKREPVPWDCTEAWTHADMRTSLGARRPPPLPRAGTSAAAAEFSKRVYNAPEGIVLVADNLPPNVFGDLTLLLDGPSSPSSSSLSSSKSNLLSHHQHNHRSSSSSSSSSRSNVNNSSSRNPLRGVEQDFRDNYHDDGLRVKYWPPRDHWAQLRRLFFKPPLPLNAFVRLLGGSVVGEDPPLTEAALSQRLYDAGRTAAAANLNASNSNGKNPPWTQRSGQAIAAAILRDARAEDEAAEAAYARARAPPPLPPPGSSRRYAAAPPPPPVPPQKLCLARGTAIPLKWLHERLVEMFGAPSNHGSSNNHGSGNSSGGSHRQCAGDGPRIGSNRSGATVLVRVRRMLIDVCGVFGLGELQRQLSLMDTDGSSTLDPGELKTGLSRLGLYLNNREVEEIFYEFDRDRSGGVSYDEFMAGIRGPLPAVRRELVEDAWRILVNGGGGGSGGRHGHVGRAAYDRSCSGGPSSHRHDGREDRSLKETMPLDELCHCFNCEWYPSVHAWKQGNAPPGQAADPSIVIAAMANYLESTAALREDTRYDDDDNSRGGRGRGNGGEMMVNFDTFLQYHWDVSAVVQGDRLFEAVVRNTWQISPR